MGRMGTRELESDEEDENAFEVPLEQLTKFTGKAPPTKMQLQEAIEKAATEADKKNNDSNPNLDEKASKAETAKIDENSKKDENMDTHQNNDANSDTKNEVTKDDDNKEKLEQNDDINNTNDTKIEKPSI